jgi:hypothetical protein
MSTEVCDLTESVCDLTIQVTPPTDDEVKVLETVPDVVNTNNEADEVKVQPVTPQEEQLFKIERDNIYDKVPGNILFRYGLQLDGDVYRYEKSVDEKGQEVTVLKQVLSHRNKYLTSDSFRVKEPSQESPQDVSHSDTSTDSKPEVIPVNLKKLNDFMYTWGKIPTFLEIRQTENKGLGVFTKKRLGASVFLGFYGGFYRPTPLLNNNNRYLYTFADFDKNTLGAIDADNLLFSNFTRYINDGKSPNLDYVSYNYQCMCYTNREIDADEELTVSYGEDYWKTFGPKHD